MLKKFQELNCSCHKNIWPKSISFEVYVFNQKQILGKFKTNDNEHSQMTFDSCVSLSNSEDFLPVNITFVLALSSVRMVTNYDNLLFWYFLTSIKILG